MDPRNFIALAGKFAAVPTADEATYRTAISRAYYGAFHVARQFLEEIGFTPVGNANVHGFVRHYLIGSRHREACRAADELSDLQSARNRADYDLADRELGSQALAMVCVERAHRVVSALESCRTEVVRESIRNAMTEYDQRRRPG